ncbi:hypothetical protein [Candidatus Magnetaquicoccus inordinatus]|uniref:hypothetical protein n=1 Tax=Candidatus Magnetaquicoccus inordinatus TaxID=2496818 RepID=UPI00102C99FF|nr:hypothetical protein [Candidatus Magnetaquicoccus inordinatus]
MNSAFRYLMQGLFYAAFCGVIFYLSTSPRYQYLDVDKAEIMVAFKHPTKRKELCHERTAEELQKLPPNMRRQQDCPRERSPLVIRFSLDGTMVQHKEFRAPGIHRDGATFVYAKFFIPAGEHRFKVEMRDSMQEGYDYTMEQPITFRPGQMLVVGFDENVDKFTLK